MANPRKKGQSAQSSASLASRTQLIEAASDLMIERGTTDVTLSDISIRSGVNAALVKYYFGNKAGLQMALLRSRLAPGMAQLQHLAAMSASPLDKLRIHISGIVATYLRYPYVNRLMHELVREDDSYGKMIADEIARPVLDLQCAILEEGAALGVFKPVDPMMFYFHVIGACDQIFHGRYQLKFLFNVEEIDDDLRRRYVDHLYATLTHGIVIQNG